MIAKITSVIQSGIESGAAGLVVDTTMLLVTFISVLCAFAAYFHQKNRGKKDAACKLAKYYADSILGEYHFISVVLENAGLDVKIRNAINFNELRFFDRTELEDMLKEKKISYVSLMNELYTIDPVIILKSETIRFSHDVRPCIQDLVKKYEATGNLSDDDTIYLRRYFMQCVVDFLNSLEWFCMNCQYGLADEEILYQSLQKTFSSAVWLLSPIICCKNTNAADKTYTNIIWLFVLWRKRLTKRVAREKKRIATLERKVAKTKAQIRKSIFTGKKLK